MSAPLPPRTEPTSRRRSALKRAIAFAALLSFGAPASAEETYPTRRFGWWEVYGWNKDCWMKASFEGGTQIIFSWDLKSPKLFVMFRNAKWASIVDDRTYRVRLVIDGWGIYEDATGSNKGPTNPGVSLFVDQAQEDVFLARLYAGRSLDLYVAGRSAGSYSLKDSGAAIRELVSCARALEPAADEDPFTLTI